VMVYDLELPPPMPPPKLSVSLELLP